MLRQVFFNVRRVSDGMLMLGNSVPTENEAMLWVYKYRTKYPNDEWELAVDAPETTIDIVHVEEYFRRQG